MVVECVNWHHEAQSDLWGTEKLRAAFPRGNLRDGYIFDGVELLRSLLIDFQKFINCSVPSGQFGCPSIAGPVGDFSDFHRFWHFISTIALEG
jgi:hypothetical protein